MTNLKRVLAEQTYHGKFRNATNFATNVLLRMNMMPKNLAFKTMDIHFNTTQLSVSHVAELYERLQLSNETRKIALIHIPKTAGTSARVTIGKALGVAPLTTYGNSKSLPPNQWQDVNFWPFFAGHTNYQNFPLSHTALTFFRESRSRVLSGFRQIERGVKRDKSRKPKNRDLPRFLNSHTELTITNWIEIVRKRTAARYFFPGSEEAFHEFYSTASELEIAKAFAQGLARVEYAAWSHDSDALESTITAVLKTETKLERLNTFEQGSDYDPIKLSKENVQALIEVCRIDDLLIEVAVQIGIIPALSRNEADDLFELTAARLGFQLP